MRVLAVIGLLLLARFALHAQENQDEGYLAVLCQAKEDTIQLRWAPSNWEVLAALIENGVEIQTMTVVGSDTLFESMTMPFPSATDLLAQEERFPDVKAIQALIYEDGAQQSSDAILSNFETFQVNQMRHGLLLFMADLQFELAKFLVMGWEDQLTPDHLRTYFISIPGSRYSTSVFAGMLCRSELEPIQTLLSIPEDHLIVLNWDVTQNSSGYIAFNVERSDDGSNWERVNQYPIAISEEQGGRQQWVTYQDSVDENLRTYYYRIRGLNSFGRAGPPSTTHRSSARPRLEINLPYITEASNVADTSIEMRWQIGGPDSVNIDQISVLHAPSPDSNYRILSILPGDSRTYLHRDPGRSNYYIVQAKDKYGRLYTGPHAYGLLPDHEPPEAPKNLTVVTDSVGNIQLKWSANTEDDMAGYRVFFRRHAEDEPTQLTTALTSSPEFTHKLELDLLHHHAFYMIRAEDIAGNRSANSAFVKVEVPDTVRPARPTIVFAKSQLDGILLSLSLSTTEDIESQILMRKIDDGNWEQWLTGLDYRTGFRQEFRDSLVPAGATASYQLIALDSALNSSKSNIAVGRRYDNKIRAAARNAWLRWSKDEGVLTFSWECENRSDLEYVRILRSPTSSEGYYRYKVLRVDNLEKQQMSNGWVQMSFKMPLTPFIQQWYYKIQLDFSDGALSGFVDVTENSSRP